MQGRAGLREPENREWNFIFAFPGMTFNLYPDQIDFWVNYPIDERRTLGTYDYFFSEDVPQKTIDEMIAFNEQVGLEDNGLVEAVHAGLESGMVEHGRRCRRASI